MRSPLTRPLFTLAIALVAALSLSTVAHAAAGGVHVYDYGDYKVVQYTGTADVNKVTFGGSASAHTVTIAEAGIADPGPGDDPGNICALTSQDTLTCTDPELGAVQFYEAGSASMGGGNDVTTGTGTQAWDVYGAEGDDSLTGSDQGDDYIRGGPGNDTLDGRGGSGVRYADDDLYGDEGNDVVHGGPGPDYVTGDAGDDDLDGGDGDDGVYGGLGVDIVRGSTGDDYIGAGEGDGELSEGGDGSDYIDCAGDANEVYDGGPGFDSIECYGEVENPAGFFEPDDYVLDLAGGLVRRTNHVQTVSTVRSMEDAETGDGDDVLVGTDGANSLWAGSGNDSINGRGGTDYIWAGIGNDTVETGDGAPDRADGGPGSDACHADQIDELFACEALTLAPSVEIPSGTADRSAPHCTLSRVAGNRSKGRITFSASCDENATLGAEAVGRVRRLSGGALASRVGDVTLGSRSAKATAGATVRVTLRVARRYRRALPRRSRIRLVLHATDTLGNHSRISRLVRMR